MKKVKLFATALMLALPAVVLGGEAKPAAQSPPKGHPPVAATQSLPKGHPPLAAPQAKAKPQTKAQTGAQAAGPIAGKVLETMDSGGYTYIRLQQKGEKKLWVAIPVTKVAAGAEVVLVPGAEMKNFKSKTMNRTFDRIIFSAGIIPPKGTKEGAQAPLANQGSKGAAVAAEKVKVAKAAGSNAHTVAELFALRGSLDGKKVVVKGKVVKVTRNIMQMNWLHIQDGTGTPSKNDHDLVVTTKAVPAEGKTVTVSGILRKDKDYGSGYKYDVIIENAEIGR